MRRFFSVMPAAVSAVLLAACGSSVRLDEPPVETRSPTPVASASAPASTSASAVQPRASGAAATTVAPVEISASSAGAAGPAGATKIIFFDYDSFTIKPEFQGAIEAHARFMAANKTRRLAIEGHTDERGGREYNLALGQKRAEAVRRALGLLGVTDAQVEAVSFGEEKPSSAGTDEAALARNRRAELSYR